MSLTPQRFEPVYLQLGETRITDHGKRWLERRFAFIDGFGAVLRDIAKLATTERWQWPRIQRQLNAEGVPQAIANGVSQYAMHLLVDHLNGKTSFTMPAAVAMTLCTANPTVTSTGASQAETVYTNYARQAILGAGFNAATTASPSVATNAGVITFPNCGATGSTLLGFTLCDSATIGAGNMLWFGPLTSTVISSTQTPPTVAAAALSLSMAITP